MLYFFLIVGLIIEEIKRRSAVLNLSNHTSYLLIAIAFIISYFLTPFFRKLSISVYLAFVIPLIILAKDIYNPIYGVIIGGGLIFLVGLISDIKKLSPITILIVQFVSALILVLYGIGITIKQLPFGFSLIFSILWIILIVDAFRIINIVNGFVEGMAIIATIPLFVIGWLNGDITVIFLCCALAGACLGFLRYRFPTAQTSLNNAGSMLIGFIIAAITMAINYTDKPFGHKNLLAFVIAPLFILAIPLYDTAVCALKTKLTTARSKKRFVQHLTDIGFSASEALLISCAVAFFLGVFAVLITYVSPTWAAALSFWMGSAFIGLLYQLNQAPIKTLTSFANEIKRVVFGGGISETKSSSGIKALLKSDLCLVAWLITDIFLINTGIYIGYLVRFNGVIDPAAFAPYLHLWFILTIAHFISFAPFKLYYHPKKFSKIEVTVRTIKAVTLASIVSLCLVYILRRIYGFMPSSVFAFAWLFNIILVGGWRTFIRYDN